MVPNGLAGNEREALDSFKRALRDEYARKIESLKEAYERDFSSLIAERRMEVESKVQLLREKQASEFKAEVAAARQSAFRKMRTRVLEDISGIVGLLEESVKTRLEGLRANRGLYRAVLNGLAHEALGALAAEKAVLRVAPGEAVLLEEDPRVVLVEETPALAWGGAIAVEAENGACLVDNSLQTRWTRLKPVMIENLSKTLATLVEDVQEPLPELRLS
jgi:vacuolar-type H+-ATPase subunit E/Vma4